MTIRRYYPHGKIVCFQKDNNPLSNRVLVEEDIQDAVWDVKPKVANIVEAYYALQQGYSVIFPDGIERVSEKKGGLTLESAVSVDEPGKELRLSSIPLSWIHLNFEIIYERD